MVARVGRLVVTAVIGTSTILTQQVVSATTVVIEQIERTDSTLADLTNTINTINGPLSRLENVRDPQLDTLASDVDTAFDQSLARVTAQLVQTPSSRRENPSQHQGGAARFGAIAVTTIEVERQALVQAIRAAAASDDPSPYHASGLRSIQLHALKLAGTIMAQRETLKVAKSRALEQAEMMVALSSAAALLLMMSLVRRRILAPTPAR